MKLIHFLAGATAIFAVATACDENNMGNSLLSTDMTVETDSTSFKLSGESVTDSKIMSRTTTQLLGVLQTPEYGELRSDIVTEFMTANEMDTTGVSVADIDSLKLLFQVPMGSYTGDSITPMRVDVYKLNRNLPYPIYSDFDPKGYYSESDLLGSTSYTMSMLGQKDSLYYETGFGPSSTKYRYRIVDVKLPLSLGQEFFTKYKTNPEIYNDPEEFKKFFPGIYATTTYGSGRVISITNTRLQMYYKKHGKTEEDKDTILPRTTAYFAVSPEIVTNNNIRLRPAESLKSQISQGEVIIQAPAGYCAQIDIPVRDIIAKYEKLTTQGLTVLNSVSIRIPAARIENDKGIDPPAYLLMLPVSKKDEFFSENKINDNISSFYAAYNSATKEYLFSGMRTYIKEIIDNGSLLSDDADKKPGIATEKDEEFLLIPVDISFETANSNSIYGSKEPQVTKIAPLVSAAAFVKLNIKEAKIIATYSKKDFQK